MTVRARRLALLLAATTVAIGACTGAGASPSGGDASQSAASSPGTSPSASASASADPVGSPPASAATEADITVTGVEYAFEGMSPSVASGTTLGFRNGGAELHEMAIYRRNDDVNQSFEDILAMPPDEGIKLVSEVGIVFAGPGQAGTDVLTVNEPGEYAMLCFIPVGMTEMPSMDPNESPGGTPSVAGPPHFTQGMVQTFTVSG